MERLVLSLFIAALFVLPITGFATSKPNTCPTCGPTIETMVYFDQNGDGKYDPGEGEETRERWRVFLYKIDTDGDWELLDSALTGGSDTVYYSGSDTGKVYFRPLRTYINYAVCAEFPREWLFLTEPTLDGLLFGSSPSGDAWVSIIENPQPLAWDDPEMGARNWDESVLCYKVKLRSSCNNVQLRFGVLTYDQTLNHPTSN